MADPVDPILDRPPTEPFDVKVSPDAPPRSLFDVAVTLDSLPSSPQDVQTYPDKAPGQPFDVSTSQDSQPGQPFDVTTKPDLPPLLPRDVSVTLDSVPVLPFDVLTYQDRPPANPVDVTVSLDSTPSSPRDVVIVPDRPPAVPFDVPTPLDSIPALPFQVATYPDLPPPPTLGLGERPTIDKIISAVKGFDGKLGNFLITLSELDPVTTGVPGGGALDPRALLTSFNNYKNAVGIGGIRQFIEQQSALYAMNPYVAKLFDPTYFLKMILPGSMGHVKVAADVEAGVTMESVARERDEILVRAVGLNQVRPGGNGTTSRPADEFGPENTFTQGQAFSVDSMVDAIIDSKIDPYLKDATAQGLPLKRFDSTSFFQDRDHTGGSFTGIAAKNRAASGVQNVFSSRLAGSAAIDGIIRVGVRGEEEDGTVLSPTANPADGTVDDDDTRVPLCFTDLRQIPGHKYRSIYFRPLNVQFGQSFAPEFSEINTFGRVDAVPGYQKTTRSITLSFELHVFAPEDLRLMHNKLTMLTSMTYPSYGSDSLFKSGPVVRLRLGDVIATDLGGVPGIIRNLSTDYNDAIWELKRGMKVPRMCKVSLDFLVLHDGPIGLVDGRFGVFQLPSAANSTSQNGKQDPGASRDSASDSFSVLPGRFSSFGEPKK